MNSPGQEIAPPLRLYGVTRIYKQAGRELMVFRDVSLAMAQGEIVALVGQSGAGKSSLLHIAGLLEAPSSGEVYIEGEAATRLPEKRRTELRRRIHGQRARSRGQLAERRRILSKLRHGRRAPARRRHRSSAADGCRALPRELHRNVPDAMTYASGEQRASVPARVARPGATLGGSRSPSLFPVDPTPMPG